LEQQFPFAWQARGVQVPVEIRDLARGEFSRVGEIDRTERIEVRLEQHGTELVARRGSWSACAWIRTDTANTPSTRSAQR
jgi:hypothetical protein